LPSVGASLWAMRANQQTMAKKKAKTKNVYLPPIDEPDWTIQFFATA
jgi:hypothetical protein